MKRWINFTLWSYFPLAVILAVNFYLSLTTSHRRNYEGLMLLFVYIITTAWFNYRLRSFVKAGRVKYVKKDGHLEKVVVVPYLKRHFQLLILRFIVVLVSFGYILMTSSVLWKLLDAYDTILVNDHVGVNATMAVLIVLLVIPINQLVITFRLWRKESLRKVALASHED